MRWPWVGRAERAEEEARKAEARLRRAQAEHDVARLVAEASRKARRENGFADMIRVAFGVEGK